jgi:hypothetical protein
MMLHRPVYLNPHEESWWMQDWPCRLRLLILEKLAAYFWRRQWGEHKEKVGGGITPYRPVLYVPTAQ